LVTAFWLAGVICLAGGIVLHRFGWTVTCDLAFFALFRHHDCTGCAGTDSQMVLSAYGGMSAFKGMLLAVFTLVPPVFAAAMWVVFPPLNEISTDLETPPAFYWGCGRRMPRLSAMIWQCRQKNGLLNGLMLGSWRYNSSPIVFSGELFR